MNLGIVESFDDKKGSGYIIQEGTGKHYFVHVSGLVDDIKKGDKVEFELQEGKTGLNAINLKLIKSLIIYIILICNGIRLDIIFILIPIP